MRFLSPVSWKRGIEQVNWSRSPYSVTGTVQTRDAPAKINLWLEVIGKREDGYHDISSLMLPISIFDRLTIEVRPEVGTVSIACDVPEIPSDEQNLAWRAADLYLRTSGIKAGVHIDLQKIIPSGAGLGGGSSNAASVLMALNSLFQNALHTKDLERLALSLGADVPFFLHARPALATGIGEKLQFVDLRLNCSFLLIKPPIAVPTHWVYKNLKLTKGLPQIRLCDLNRWPERLGDLVQNDLESVTVKQYPVIAEIKSWLTAHGAMAALMSGSGSTVFGIFEPGRMLEDALGAAKRDWPDCWINTAEVLDADFC